MDTQAPLFKHNFSNIWTSSYLHFDREHKIISYKRFYFVTVKVKNNANKCLAKYNVAASPATINVQAVPRYQSSSSFMPL